MYKNWFHLLPSYRFQALLNLFPKFFSPFLHSTCLLSVLLRYLALRDNHHAFSSPFPKRATLLKHSVRVQLEGDGILTLYDQVFQPELPSVQHWRYFSRLQFKASFDYEFELFPVHSPLLRKSYSFSFPPLTYMLKFSG